ncbi:hypothetical protein AAE478_007035 [Parahypoxylon ruwenzoriense]
MVFIPKAPTVGAPDVAAPVPAGLLDNTLSSPPAQQIGQDQLPSGAGELFNEPLAPNPDQAPVPKPDATGANRPKETGGEPELPDLGDGGDASTTTTTAVLGPAPTSTEVPPRMGTRTDDGGGIATSTAAATAAQSSISNTSAGTTGNTLPGYVIPVVVVGVVLGLALAAALCIFCVRKKKRRRRRRKETATYDYAGGDYRYKQGDSVEITGGTHGYAKVEGFVAAEEDAPDAAGAGAKGPGCGRRGDAPADTSSPTSPLGRAASAVSSLSSMSSRGQAMYERLGAVSPLPPEETGEHSSWRGCRTGSRRGLG